MRNLKKFLALVLAMMMVMGLMVTVNAADTIKTDAPITADYQTAVNVLFELGVLKGGTGGIYHPQETISRAEFAMMLFRINTGITKDSMTAAYAQYANFKDVPAGYWAAGAIGYVQENGLMKGVGGGNFNPAGEISGYEVMTGLLRVLGYDAYGELSGSQWAINTLIRASDIGMTDDLVTTATLSLPATRETVAQLFFTTLVKTTLVSYNAEGGTYSDNITNGNKPPLGELKFDMKVVKSNSDYADLNLDEPNPFVSDDLGRPQPISALVVSGKLIYVEDAVPNYTLRNSVRGSAVYATVGSTVAGAGYTWSYYADGTTTTPGKPDATMTSGGWNGTATGSVTEIYVDSDAKTATVVTYHTYIAKVTRVTEATAAADRYITLGSVGSFTTDSFAKGDTVLYTYSNKQVGGDDAGIQSVQLAGTVTGKLEKIVNGGTYVVDGVNYVKNAKGDSALGASSLNSEVSFYVDAWGNIMRDIEAGALPTNYLYVVSHGAGRDNTDHLHTTADKTATVYGVTPDGEVVTYTCEYSGSTAPGENSGTGWPSAGKVEKLFTYTVNPDTGNLVLTPVQAIQDGKTAAAASAYTDITVGAVSVSYGDSTGSNAQATAVLNSDTVFVFVELESTDGTNNTVKNAHVEIGNKNIGSTIKTTAGTGQVTALVGAEDGVAEVVYVLSGYVDPNAETDTLVLLTALDILLGTSETVKVNGSPVTTYTYYGTDNEGNPTMIWKKGATLSAGVYKINEDGSAGAKQTTGDNVYENVTVKAVNGSTVTFGSTPLNVNIDNVIFLGDDVEMKEGQIVTYVKGTNAAINDAVVVWVIEDQYIVESDTSGIPTTPQTPSSGNDSATYTVVADDALNNLIASAAGGTEVHNYVTFTVKRSAAVPVGQTATVTIKIVLQEWDPDAANWAQSGTDWDAEYGYAEFTSTKTIAAGEDTAEYEVWISTTTKTKITVTVSYANVA